MQLFYVFNELTQVITFVKETNDWVGGDELDFYKQGEENDKVWIFVEYDLEFKIYFDSEL